MIRINEDWVVDVDEYNYTLKQDLHKKTPRKNKNGTVEEIDAYKVRGYYSNLSCVLNRLLDIVVTDSLSGDEEISLKEAIGRIEDCTNWWRKITKDILEVKN